MMQMIYIQKCHERKNVGRGRAPWGRDGPQKQTRNGRGEQSNKLDNKKA